MSQNQNPNPTLTIKGKEFPCRITMGAMLRFKRERGKDAGKIDENDLLDLITFIWCCVSSASVADGVEFNLSLEEFADNLEPTNLQVFTEHMNSQKKNCAGEGEEVAPDIEELLGVAMGCIGMSMQDFSSCTPFEFKSIFDAWEKRQQSIIHDEWHRIRTLCMCVVQPYSEERLVAKDFMPFPWEESPIASSPKELTNQEIRERFATAKKRWGLK